VDTNLVYGFIGIAVLLLCSALVSAEVLLFSLSQTDVDEAAQGNAPKGKIIRSVETKTIGNAKLVANKFHQYRGGDFILYRRSVFSITSPGFKVQSWKCS
jgi:chorismate-pyruvate lyase